MTVTNIGFGVSIGVEMLLENELEMVDVAMDVDEGTDGLGVDEDPPGVDVDVVVAFFRSSGIASMIRSRRPAGGASPPQRRLPKVTWIAGCRIASSGLGSLVASTRPGPSGSVRSKRASMRCSSCSWLSVLAPAEA